MSTDAGGIASGARSGARWSLITSGLVQASTMVSTMLSSRLLTKSQFGIVAATSVVAGLYSMIGQTGFGASVSVGRREDENASASFFWSAIIVGTAVFVVAFLTAPIAADLIGHPEATNTIRGATFAIPFLMSTTVAQRHFFRRLRYRVGYTSDIVTAALTAVGPAVLLLAGWGAWGVILPRVLAAVLGLFFLLLLGRWLPKRHLDRKLLRANSRFSANYFGLRLAGYTQSNMDYWIVGNLVSAAAFSAYYVAFVLPNLVRQRATQTLEQLLTPLLVKVRDEPARLREVYERISTSVSSLAVPMLIGLAVTADLVIRIAFGPGWGAAVVPMQIMSVMAAVDVFSMMASSVFLANERIEALRNRSLVKIVCLGVALVPVIWIRTIDAAAFASLVGAVSGAVFTQMALKTLIGQTFGDLARALWPMLLATAVMAAAVVGARTAMPPLNVVAELLASVAVGIVAYLGFLRLALPRHFKAMAGDLRELTRR